MLQKEVIEAGEKMASDLFDAQISKDMGTSGGHVVKDMSEYDNGDLIQKYLDGEIVSVEAIYTAMKRVEENCLSHNNARMPSLCDKHYPNGGCPHLKGNFCGVECEETAPVA